MLDRDPPQCVPTTGATHRDDLMDARLCEVAEVLCPWVRCGWWSVESQGQFVPALLFVSRSVRRAFLACMHHHHGGVARFPCSAIVYELHVHATPAPLPGVSPSLPLHWVARYADGGGARVPCTALWSRSRDSAARVHEDAWDVMPSLHDGSTCAYDVGALLSLLGMGSSLAEFYERDVVPMLDLVEVLRARERRYRAFTHARGLRRVGATRGVR